MFLIVGWLHFGFCACVCVCECVKCSFFVIKFVSTASTHDQDVFSFYEDDRYCHGFEEVLSRYRELVPQLRLAG